MIMSAIQNFYAIMVAFSAMYMICADSKIGLAFLLVSGFFLLKS